MFSAAKDAVTSKAAQVYVNGVIERYGHLEEFRIDSKRNRVEMVCQLIGETTAIGVTIENYRVEVEGDQKYIMVLESSATRPWMQAVMRDHLNGRRFALPGWAAAAL